ncbi:MAG: hypothetical protein LC648_09905 [Novosphingobium sp.]|nr:hypothetical protein [Novosphingobium sp.]
MSDRDPAFPRWLALQGVRFVGVVTVLIGVLIEAGRLPGLSGVPRWLGYVLAVAGLVAVFALPRLIARRWRSPPQ